MPKQSARRRTPKRPKLRGEHYATYWLILYAFDYTNRGGGFDPTIHMSEWDAKYVRGCIQRLARIAGVTHDKPKLSTVYDDAMKAIYMRVAAESSYDTSPAFRCSERIRQTIERNKPKHEEQTGADVSEEERTIIRRGLEMLGYEGMLETMQKLKDGEPPAEVFRRMVQLKREQARGKKNADDIDALRERLRELEEEGEAHNESGIFALRRKIYDAEHADAPDDWSEWEEDA